MADIKYNEGDRVWCLDSDGKEQHGNIYLNTEHPDVSEWYIRYDDGEECAVLDVMQVYPALPLPPTTATDLEGEAAALIDKFMFSGIYFTAKSGNLQNAKQCAIIHLEGLKSENLSLLEMANLHMDNRAVMVLNHRLSHLNHLRQAIEKM